MRNLLFVDVNGIVAYNYGFSIKSVGLFSFSSVIMVRIPIAYKRRRDLT